MTDNNIPVVPVERVEKERPGDYRKPNRRPADKPFVVSNDIDRLSRESEWFNWLLFEMSVRLGAVERSGNASPSPVSAVNVEHLCDAFLDKFDEMQDREQSC